MQPCVNHSSCQIYNFHIEHTFEFQLHISNYLLNIYSTLIKSYIKLNMFKPECIVFIPNLWLLSVFHISVNETHHPSNLAQKLRKHYWHLPLLHIKTNLSPSPFDINSLLFLKNFLLYLSLLLSPWSKLPSYLTWTAAVGSQLFLPFWAPLLIHSPYCN